MVTSTDHKFIPSGHVTTCGDGCCREETCSVCGEHEDANPQHDALIVPQESWHVSYAQGRDGYNRWIVKGESTDDVVAVVGKKVHGDEEIPRRARLLAASPKLLAALEAVTTAFGEHLIDLGGPDPEDRYTAILDQARAAIALTREG